MKKYSYTSAVIAAVLFTSISAGAEVVFLDTFSYDGGDAGSFGSDINANIPARQSGGTTTSTYTATATSGLAKAYLRESDGNLYNSDILQARVYETNVAQSMSFDLGTDFGSSLSGKKWSLSYKGRLSSAGAVSAWSGFSVGNPANTPKNNSTGGFGFVLFKSGSYGIWNGATQVGSGVVSDSVDNVKYDLSAIFDEIAGTVSISISLHSATTVNYDLGTYTTSFADGSRYVEFSSLVNGDASAVAGVYFDSRIDDITIETIPEPASLALIVISGTGAVFVRRAVARAKG
ncbi:MAG: PEP-CTERM sorting domain-containing protein [Kiritimatiellales bacterium]